MKKLILFLIPISISFIPKAQTVSDFENLILTPNSYRDGRDSMDANGFTSGKAHYNNLFDTSFGGYWAGGFAISNKTDISLDSATVNFTKLYTVITGKGVFQSPNYAIGQNHAVLKLTDSQFKRPYVISITNTNYAYLSMKWGDQIARKFNDSDFFHLHLIGYLNGLPTDTLQVELANGQDIMDTWFTVNLIPLGAVDSIVFSLVSSDNGQFGMNTPAYFCIDNFEVTRTDALLENNKEEQIAIYPNPASEKIFLSIPETEIKRVTITNLQGEQIQKSTNNILHIDNLKDGIYFLTIDSEKGIKYAKFIKYTAN